MLDHVVVSSLLPVVLLIAVGFAASRMGVVSAAGTREISNLAFLVLSPVLLFRTMATVHPEQLDFAPVALYFGAAVLLFAATLAVQGLNRRGAVLGLACTFSNTVMIGIPLITLAYGDQGLVILLTLVSVHALALLTIGTVVLEVAVARERVRQAPSDGPEANAHASASAGALRTVALAARGALLHPVPLPILAGLLYAQTGWGIPALLDKPLQWLGSAFGPLALLLVGMTLAGKTAREHWNTAFGLVLAKNFALPLTVALLGYAWGLSGMALTVIVVTASLPMGANVFLFSQRYQVAEREVTAAVALSTLAALVSVSLAMLLLPR